VLADEGRARILELCRPGGELRVVEDLVDPLATPPPGEDVSDASAQRFARQIVDRLERAFDEARFEYLRLAAAPRFLDRLRHEIDKYRDLHRGLLDWVSRNLMELEPEEGAASDGALRGPDGPAAFSGRVGRVGVKSTSPRRRVRNAAQLSRPRGP
jgi:hypothetical protein